MTKGLEVFTVGHEAIRYDLEGAKSTLKAKLDPQWIKQRTQGKATLSYIGGNTVIHLLNHAFNYQWSFEIVSEDIVQSIPKVNKWAKGDQPKTEEQPPVAKVLGRLTVPGLGIKEQYGSKVLIGGASEQESAFKSASTDALKKCASLFGIGLELYGDEEYNFEEQQTSTPEPVKPVSQPKQEQQAPASQTLKPTTPAQEQPAKPAKQEPAQAQTASAGAVDHSTWDQNDINRLKELKAILGVTENSQLDPYVREFLDSQEMTYLNIVPQNVKAFNIFLAKKAESV
jgi:recombination DNA repair RAD52 pathway protein